MSVPESRQVTLQHTEFLGNPPYVITFIIFMIVTIPTALFRNAPAFVFLRFVQGFFGSPVLATGGASIADVYDEAHVSIAMNLWGFACFVAPPIGTTIAAAGINQLGWRFSIWEILIASAPILIMLLILPETNTDTILYNRAKRLRRATGNERIRSQSEINQAHLDFKTIVKEALYVPALATIQDPAVLFASVYLMLIYGIYYSFFEAFPLVYEELYHFELLQQGLAFMPLAVGTIIGAAAYIAFLWYSRRPKLLTGTPLPQKQSSAPPSSPPSSHPWAFSSSAGPPTPPSPGSPP
ncbi:hypothetical protein PRZ48_013155 [Zasmidium cellare]|uniref:Major facilitator superfamily (MFS) profile domain-containing protein n=1 Tax=Zasmidium cellare TaxID=395010 RepID=A0ABR0E384_ZASCE|nr:hypothetical protein PRZ48_013155 [Zasmidium cellare]